MFANGGAQDRRDRCAQSIDFVGGCALDRGSQFGFDFWFHGLHFLQTQLYPGYADDVWDHMHPMMSQFNVGDVCSACLGTRGGPPECECFWCLRNDSAMARAHTGGSNAVLYHMPWDKQYPHPFVKKSDRAR